MAGGYDASGIYSRWFSWQDDAANGIKIVADRHDTEDNEFSNALSLCILKDGRSVISNNIPFNGKRIVNLADPDPSSPQDAATKNYCDTMTGWPKSKSISGTGTDGRLNFTGTSGVNGIGWTYADLSWVAKGATASQTPNRLVLNDKVDATGTDVFIVDEGGRANFSTWTHNASYDGAAWRTPVAGKLSILSGVNGVWTWTTNWTATTSAYGPATTNTAMIFNGVTGGLTIYGPSTAGTQSAQIQLIKSKSGDYSRIAGYRGATARWTMDLGNNTAESGSNAGSDFALNRYSDAGALLGTGMTIDRSSGDATFGGHINLPGNVNNGQTTSTHLYGNLQCKNGLAIAGGNYGGNVVNFLWNTAAMVLFVDNTNLGTINTTSDYRIKKDVADLPSTWEQVKTLRPISYTQAAFTPGEAVEPLFADDDITRWGFIAHETQEALLSTAASGEKDMLDGVQGLNWAPIVAALTRCLQEAQSRIEGLEERLTLLEGRSLP
jgi:Chaperone of endosialidase